MALEIERKFLLQSEEWRALARSRQLLRQGYNFNLAQRPYRSW